MVKKTVKKVKKKKAKQSTKMSLTVKEEMFRDLVLVKANLLMAQKYLAEVSDELNEILGAENTDD